jgi:cyclopropane fatty-acyl-phospholipid synthase-like methyltransferase
VLGIDLAENLIELAKTKARDRGLENIEFRVADMLDLDLPPSTFDVVICVFGIFCRLIALGISHFLSNHRLPVGRSVGSFCSPFELGDGGVSECRVAV